MVRDYDKQKEEDKKNGTERRMTQGEWYTQHAVGYGLQIRKKQAAMKKALCAPWWAVSRRRQWCRRRGSGPTWHI